jgi:dTDP-4-amino-4,6-dideoxygalactose transaminase
MAQIRMMNLPEQIEQLRTSFMNDLSEIIHSGNYVSGAWVAKFESEFSAFTKVQHSVMVNSGTSALHAVLESLDLKKGDEIIVPAHTFIATASAVLLAGAVPVIVDIENSRPHIDVSAIQAAISDQTVGIIPVHLYGGMADMVQIYALAKSKGLFVLEDSAQAHGANRQGLIPGQQSIASTYSFYPGKNLGGIGEGGAISTIDADIASRVRAFRSWGGVERYDHSKFGLNYRMDEIQACALSHKLELLAKANFRRREIAKTYIDNLETDNVNASLLGESVHHIFAIKHPNRDALRTLLNQKGIQTSIHYPKPIHMNDFMPSRSKTPFETTNAISLCSQILSIPIHSSLTDHDVEYVIESVNDAVKQIQV